MDGTVVDLDDTYFYFQNKTISIRFDILIKSVQIMENNHFTLIFTSFVAVCIPLHIYIHTTPKKNTFEGFVLYSRLYDQMIVTTTQYSE